MENTEILVAKEFFNQVRPIIADKNFSTDEKMKFISDLALKFAKRHCEAQLKAILKNVKTKSEYWEGLDDGVEVNIIDRDSILNAYDLDNIK